MNDATIATGVLASISALLTGVSTGAAEAAGNQLYSEVARRMRRNPGTSDAFAAFEATPDAPETRQALLRYLLTELRADGDFRTRMAALIAPDNSVTSTHVSARSSGVAVGRDYTSTTSTKKTNYGGIVVALVAVAAIALVLLLGRTVVNNVFGGSATGGLSGTSTCRDFLASADSTAKAQVMKQLYLDRNKTRRAADPFILQNADAMCGAQSRVDVTLAQIADVAQEG